MPGRTDSTVTARTRHALIVAISVSLTLIPAAEARLSKEQTVTRGDGICKRLNRSVTDLRRTVDTYGEPYPGFRFHGVARRVNRAAKRFKRLGNRTGYRGRAIKRAAEGFRLEAIKWRATGFYYSQGDRRRARRTYNRAYGIALRRGDNLENYGGFYGPHFEVCNRPEDGYLMEISGP